MDKRDFVQALKREGLTVRVVRKGAFFVCGHKGYAVFDVSGLSAGHALYAKVTRACVECGDTSTRHTRGTAIGVLWWLRDVSTHCLCCGE